MCYTNGPRCSNSLAVTINTLKSKLEREELNNDSMPTSERTSMETQIHSLKEERDGTPTMQKVLRRQAERSNSPKERAEKLGYADYCADLYAQKKEQGKALTAIQRSIDAKNKTKMVPMSAEVREVLHEYLSDQYITSFSFMASSDSTGMSPNDEYMETGGNIQGVINNFTRQGNNHLIAKKLLERKKARLDHYESSQKGWGDRGWNTDKVDKWKTEAAILQTAVYTRQDEKDSNSQQYTVDYSDGVGHKASASFSSLIEANAYMQTQSKEHPGYDDTTHVVLSRKGNPIAKAGTDGCFRYDAEDFKHGFVFIAK